NRNYADYKAYADNIEIAIAKSGTSILTKQSYDASEKKSSYNLMTLSKASEKIGLAAKAVLAIAVLMLVFWIFEIVPIYVTSLLPIVMFPLLSVASLSSVAFPGYFIVTSEYANHLIFLFMGTFMLAKAIEKWHLDKRIAIKIIKVFGTNPKYLLLGFILTTAFLSMWISNTATTAMMIPIALALLKHAHHDKKEMRFETGLLLAIAYAASIGGLGTIIGSPPNAVFAGFAQSLAKTTITFVGWMKFGLPFVILFIPICWLYMSWRYTEKGIRLGEHLVTQRLGKFSQGEKNVAIIFAVTALLWLSRSAIPIIHWPGWSSLKPFGLNLTLINDSAIAIAAAIALYLVPASLKKYEPTLDLETGFSISWGTLILFGGGLTLGAAIANTGVAAWFAELLTVFSGVHVLILLIIISALAVVLTEFTSNTATATMLMPVMFALGAAMAAGNSNYPLVFMATAAVATSLSFVLPIATPPNAIAYGTGKIKLKEMIHAGIALDILGILLWSVMAASIFGVLF
ncbi:hypothetical protein COT47_02745, partial [Candidatus Woesearchaeota archaeon CG08_land_8_20_14_0_20_43_7]